MKIKATLVKSGIFFSIIFTTTTLISSVIQLIGGQINDTNAHILLRGGFILIATITYVLYGLLKINNRTIAYFVTYTTALILIFGLLFALSLYEPWHPTAYTDAFFNFSFVAIPVMITLAILEWKKNKN